MWTTGSILELKTILVKITNKLNKSIDKKFQKKFWIITLTDGKVVQKKQGKIQGINGVEAKLIGNIPVYVTLIPCAVILMNC